MTAFLVFIILLVVAGLAGGLVGVFLVMILGIIIAVLITISEVINHFRQKECPHCRLRIPVEAETCHHCRRNIETLTFERPEKKVGNGQMNVVGLQEDIMSRRLSAKDLTNKYGTNIDYLKDFSEKMVKRVKDWSPDDHEKLLGLEASGNKECPYCVETIKAKAVLYRYCGKDLQ